MKKTHGVVRRKTIVLDQEVGLPDGQKVEVVIRVIADRPGAGAWGEG